MKTKMCRIVVPVLSILPTLVVFAEDPFVCIKDPGSDFFRLIPQVGVTHVFTDDASNNAVWDMAVSPEGRVFFSSCGESYVPAYARLYEYDHGAKKLIEHFRLEEKISGDDIGLRPSKFHTALSFVGGGWILTTSHTTSPSPRHPTWMPYEYQNHPYEGFKGSDLLMYNYITHETKGLGKACFNDTIYGATYDPINGDYFMTTWMRGDGLVYNLKDGSMRRLGQVSDSHTSRAFLCSDGHIYSSTFSGAMYRYNTTIRDIEYLGVSVPGGLVRHAVEIDGVLYFTTGSCGVWGRCMDLYSYNLSTRELKLVGKPVPQPVPTRDFGERPPEYHAYGLAVDSKKRLWYGCLAITPTIKYAGAKLFMWDFMSGKQPVDCGWMGTKRHTVSISEEMRIVDDVLYISDGNHTGYEDSPCAMLAIDIEPFVAALENPNTPRENSHDFVNYLIYEEGCRKFYPKGDFEAEYAKYLKYDREVVQRFRRFAKTSAYRYGFKSVSGISVWEKIGRKNVAVKKIVWTKPDALSFWCGDGYRIDASLDSSGKASVVCIAECEIPRKEPLAEIPQSVILPGIPGRQHLAVANASVRLSDGSLLVGTKDDMLALVSDGEVRNEGALASAGPVHDLVLAPDGKTVYGVAGHDRGVGMLFRYTRKKGAELLGLVPEAASENGRTVALYRPTVLAVSPDGRYLAVGGDDDIGGVAVLGL